MSSETNDFRYERKWVLPKFDHSRLLMLLINSKFFFSEQYPDRKVNTLYYDNRNLRSIKENLYGNYYKKKIRIRWYSNDLILKKPRLEIKEKEGDQNKKKIIPLLELENLDIRKSTDLSLITNIVNKKIYQKEKLIPILTTHYDRKYLISPIKKIRATIDYNLFSTKIFPFFENFKDYFKFDKNIILEFKYSIKHFNFVNKNLKNLNLRITKNSKYVSAFFSKKKEIINI